MPRTNTSLKFAQAYDPTWPIRTRQSRMSAEETTAEMASIVALKVTAHPDSCVTEEDLRNAGFTSREISLYYPDAAVLASERLAPTVIETVPNGEPSPQAPAPTTVLPRPDAATLSSKTPPIARRQRPHKRSRAARSS